MRAPPCVRPGAGLATLAPCLRAPCAPLRPSRVRFQRVAPTHPLHFGLPPSPPVGGFRPSLRGLRASAPAASARATALLLSPAPYGSSGFVHMFFPLSVRVQNRSVGVGSALCGHAPSSSLRAVALVGLLGRERPARHKPLSGTAVVATLRFFSATALFCVHPLRRFPPGAVARGLPPSECVRMPATCSPCLSAGALCYARPIASLRDARSAAAPPPF